MASHSRLSFPFAGSQDVKQISGASSCLFVTFARVLLALCVIISWVLCWALAPCHPREFWVASVQGLGASAPHTAMPLGASPRSRLRIHLCADCF